MPPLAPTLWTSPAAKHLILIKPPKGACASMAPSQHH